MLSGGVGFNKIRPEVLGRPENKTGVLIYSFPKHVVLA